MKRFKRKGRKSVNSNSRTYNGIKFKSDLELFAYKELNKVFPNTKYEEETYEVFPSFEISLSFFKNTPKRSDIYEQKTKKIRSINYTPDFINHEYKFIIETKGRRMKDFDLRWKMFLYYCEKNKFKEYKKFIPRNQAQVLQCIQEISKP